MTDDELRDRLDDVERDLTGVSASQVEQWREVLRGDLPLEAYVERHGEADPADVRDWRRPR